MNKFPVAIKLISHEDLKKANDLYEDHFEFLTVDEIPCYIVIEGLKNNQFSWFGANASNKDELLKNINLISIKDAVKIETDMETKMINDIENKKIDDLFL